nr:uncharacterized protein LOC126524200 [Dermacentor andersoni]
MRGRASEFHHSKSPNPEPAAPANAPDSHNRKVSEADHEHVVVDSAAASKTKRPAKKSKKHRKVEGSASRTTLEPVGGAGASVGAASVGAAWMAPPIGDVDKRTSSASGSGAETASPGPDAPSIALSPIAAPNEVAKGPKACAYTSGLPTQGGAGRQSAKDASADREPGAVNSSGATGAVATGGRAKDAVQSSGSFQLLAAGPGNPAQASTRAVSPFRTPLVASAKCASASTQLGEGTTSSPPVRKTTTTKKVARKNS